MIYIHGMSTSNFVRENRMIQKFSNKLIIDLCDKSSNTRGADPLDTYSVKANEREDCTESFKYVSRDDPAWYSIPS